jgi:indolepyruvate ferredoxin oxidoreductase beta subunit
MNLNIYLNGVGGQGVGVLAAILGEALIAAGYEIIGSDTHGLAQRHGSVSSHIRVGKDIYYPLIEENEADFVLSLERLEALRAAESMLKPGGFLLFYDSCYQPIAVRIGEKKYPSLKQIEEVCAAKKATLRRVKLENLKDFRKQNIALISVFVSSAKIPGLTDEKVLATMGDYLKYDKEENIKIYYSAKQY